LRPITEKIPKALVEIAGRPFIDWQLALLKHNGIRRVVMCVGYLGEMLRDHLGDGSKQDMEITYSFDGDKLLGTGGAIKRAEHLLGDAFWVTYGDSYMDIGYADILNRFSESDAQGLMTVLYNKNQWDTSNCVFEDGHLKVYDKHNRTPAMHHVDYGVALLRKPALDRIPAAQPHDLATLYTHLVDEKQMIGYEVHNRFYEMGSLAGLEETRQYLSQHGYGF